MNEFGAYPEPVGSSEEQPFTLGVRLDVDFDGFFRREDASAQLKLWREARTQGLSSGC